MESIKGKVKKLTTAAQVDKYGNWAHFVTLEDGKILIYKSKKEDDVRFREGEEYDFNYNVVPNPKDPTKDFKNLVFPQEQQQQGGGKPFYQKQQGFTFEQQKELDILKQKSIENQACLDAAGKYINSINMNAEKFKLEKHLGINEFQECFKCLIKVMRES